MKRVYHHQPDPFLINLSQYNVEEGQLLQWLMELPVPHGAPSIAYYWTGIFKKEDSMIDTNIKAALPDITEISDAAKPDELHLAFRAINSMYRPNDREPPISWLSFASSTFIVPSVLYKAKTAVFARRDITAAQAETVNALQLLGDEVIMKLCRQASCGVKIVETEDGKLEFVEMDRDEAIVCLFWWLRARNHDDNRHGTRLVKETQIAVNNQSPIPGRDGGNSRLRREALNSGTNGAQIENPSSDVEIVDGNVGIGQKTPTYNHVGRGSSQSIGRGNSRASMTLSETGRGSSTVTTSTGRGRGLASSTSSFTGVGRGSSLAGTGRGSSLPGNRVGSSVSSAIGRSSSTLGSFGRGSSASGGFGRGSSGSTRSASSTSTFRRNSFQEAGMDLDDPEHYEEVSHTDAISMAEDGETDAPEVEKAGPDIDYLSVSHKQNRRERTAKREIPGEVVSVEGGVDMAVVCDVVGDRVYVSQLFQKYESDFNDALDSLFTARSLLYINASGKQEPTKEIPVFNDTTLLRFKLNIYRTSEDRRSPAFEPVVPAPKNLAKNLSNSSTNVIGKQTSSVGRSGTCTVGQRLMQIKEYKRLAILGKSQQNIVDSLKNSAVWPTVGSAETYKAGFAVFHILEYLTGFVFNDICVPDVTDSDFAEAPMAMSTIATIAADCFARLVDFDGNDIALPAQIDGFPALYTTHFVNMSLFDKGKCVAALANVKAQWAFEGENAVGWVVKEQYIRDGFEDCYRKHHKAVNADEVLLNKKEAEGSI
ncbi:hypothetical protein BCR33DRAFT_850926 [Rhizoclosmatium globosum]|uniref:Uncharacterized protein n=1 Tax=Rhizoclosmatium globosum TaxID=329046 RepID=A0A1Y2C9L9_9FUNG|nr:hypothetical protein BCR33DRAFT_850926 [Rhizoclosmatium globosum]|eukprot:ORY43719.1 hypothetical protein BCR33DRAFT_850926 [Rhizoclosmatium globosum]